MCRQEHRQADEIAVLADRRLAEVTTEPAPGERRSEAQALDLSGPGPSPRVYWSAASEFRQHPVES
jgi:hypothetical protein